MLFEIDKRGVAPADHVHELLLRASHGVRAPGLQGDGSARADPARVLKDLGERAGDPRWYRMSEEILETMRRRRASTRTSTFSALPPTTRWESRPISLRRSSRSRA